MKKLITLSMLLVMSIIGIVFGYQNLKLDEVLEQTNIKIPFLEDDSPVALPVTTISKPFDSKDVSIAVDFYDSTKESQEKSIIVIDKTYIPNKGVLYKSDKVFDVLAIYDGTIIEVGKDDLAGNYVKVNHNNDLVATYKILDNISVSKGDNIKKGDKLGTSSTSQIAKGNLLLFEMQFKEVNVNPADYYNKTVKGI